jgi:flagellar motor protein MotB
VIVGWGPFDPVKRGDKAANRRVEIVVGDSL